MSTKTAPKNARYRVSIVLIVESPTMASIGPDIIKWLRAKQGTATNDTKIVDWRVHGWCPEKGKR